MILFKTVIQSNRRSLFRSLLLMSLATSSMPVWADQPIVLPPAIAGDSRPVMLLGGIEPPRIQTTFTSTVQASSDSQLLVKQESILKAPATPNNPPISIPAIQLRPAIKATKPAVTPIEETVSTVNKPADEPIQRKPIQSSPVVEKSIIERPVDPSAQPTQTIRPRVAETNRPPVSQPAANQPLQRNERVQPVPGPRGDREPEERNSRGPDSRGPDNRGPDNRGPDNRGPDNRGPDNRGPDNRGPDSRGPDSRGPDSRGPDSRGPDSRGPGLNWQPSNPAGGPTMLFVPENQPGRPMVVQGMRGPGMDPNLPNSRADVDPNKLLETPVVKRLMELMEQNVELKAQLKIQQVEMDARERVKDLEAKMRYLEERSQHSSGELQEKHRNFEKMQKELKEWEQKLKLESKAVSQMREELTLQQSKPQLESKVTRLIAPGDANVLQEKRIEVHVLDKEHAEDSKSQAVNAKLAAELKSMAEKLAKSEAAHKEAAVSKEALTKRLAELENRSRLLEEKAKSLIEQKSGESENKRSMAEKRLQEREQARQKEVEREEQARRSAEEQKKLAEEAKKQEARAKEAAKQRELKNKEEAQKEADRKEAERKEELKKKEEDKKEKKKDRDEN